jgi:hypothetical protein
MVLLPTGASSAAPAALPAADLDLVPRDALTFQTAAIGDLWRNEIVQKLWTKISKEHPEAVAEIQKGTGLEPADVERMTVVVLNSPDKDRPKEAVVVLLAKPGDFTRIVSRMVPQSKKVLRGEKTYYATEGMALYSFDNRIFIVGERTAVEAMMDRADGKKEGPLSAALSLAATGKHHMVWAFSWPHTWEICPRSCRPRTNRFGPC